MSMKYTQMSEQKYWKKVHLERPTDFHDYLWQTIFVMLIKVQSPLMWSSLGTQTHAVLLDNKKILNWAGQTFKNKKQWL